MNIPYPKVTHHGRRIIQILQGPEDQVDSQLLVRRPLVGAEIGVWRGMNSATLLARMPQLRLYMVDFWGKTAPEGADEAQSLQVTDEKCAEALEETSFAEDRRIIVQCASPLAATLVREPLDFAFVDGDHRMEQCLADLEAWWPKIKPGGWLLGHDIDNPAPEFQHFGVREAVQEFWRRHCSHQRTRFQSWPFPEMVFAIMKPDV